MFKLGFWVLTFGDSLGFGVWYLGFCFGSVFGTSIMNWRSKLKASWRSALAGAAICVVFGAILLMIRGWPVYLSYDLLFFWSKRPMPEEVVIVYLDDHSFKDLGQTNTATWDRNLHANLLERLTQDGCKLVVFDIVFSEPGTRAANTNLAEAIRRHGKVVLAAAKSDVSRPQIYNKQPLLPLPEFLDAAAGCGIAAVDRDSGPGEVARRYYIGTAHQPSFPWVAATVAGAEATKVPNATEPDRWLNYYGPPLTLPNFSFTEVTNQPPGYFRGKVIFIGARPTTLRAKDEADQFRTPYTLWRKGFTPGVEIGATAFLNVLRNDGLARPHGLIELLLVTAAGVLFGSILSAIRPFAASAAAVVGIGLVLLAAMQAFSRHVWFPWTVVAFGQIPLALAWSLRGHFHRLKFEKDVLERTLVETTRFAEATKTAAQKGGLVIPDHTLLRRVGKGAYGEVWLARNAIGAFHAVKIVQRREFPSDGPYEREFKGIQKFMPISRSHPGFVHVLHVGRNDPEGFFFYIMEVCDDASSGQRIDPAHYSPKTLATELEWRGKLSPEECLRLGLALSLALEHLHQQQLIHRDIKPGNIIYVNGAPKFADIGLVTDIRAEGREVSCLGTEGYIPPEGPGTPGADVYALGKVLYEASMGRDRRLFPEVPTAVLEQPNDALARRLNDVICKACETDPQHRYRSAMELHAGLLRLQNLEGQQPARQG
jgi:CHASE2 domain-containing sensor protein